MLTAERLQDIALELPGTERGTAWGQPVVKVGRTSLYFWNPKWGPVFGMDFDTRDFWIEADPETFFTTDHHRNYPCVLARPERVARIGCASACARTGSGWRRKSCRRR